MHARAGRRVTRLRLLGIARGDVATCPIRRVNQPRNNDEPILHGNKELLIVRCALNVGPEASSPLLVRVLPGILLVHGAIQREPLLCLYESSQKSPHLS